MGLFSSIAKAAAGPVLGSLVGGAIGRSETRDTNAMSAVEAQKNRNFQERMSSTAHRREVTDLRKAGLNPILSASRSGATTPGGAQATFQSAAADVREGARMGALVGEQIKNLKEDTSLKWHQSETEAMKVKLLFNQMKNLQEQTKSTAMDNTLKQIDVDFYSESEVAKIAKSLGMKPDTIMQLIKIFKRPMKAN